jgi:hypothetical protein
MNRRGFLASAIAAALAPRELISEIPCTCPTLSEASLEQILIDIQKYAFPRDLPIALLPNAIRYYWDQNSSSMKWELVNVYKPKIISSLGGSGDAVSEGFAKIGLTDIHASNVQDGVGLQSRRHPINRGRIGQHRGALCQSPGCQHDNDEGIDSGEYSEPSF